MLTNPTSHGFSGKRVPTPSLPTGLVFSSSSRCGSHARHLLCHSHRRVCRPPLRSARRSKRLTEREREREREPRRKAQHPFGALAE
jgi:hypothetical protein